MRPGRIAIAAGFVFTASSVFAQGSYWISDFNGSSAGYRVLRNDDAIAVVQLMLLQTGDRVVVDDPAGRIVVVDDRNVVHDITAATSPFVVPEYGDPPGLLTNLRDWISSWWETRGEQSTTTMAAVSKAGLEPELSAASAGPNFLRAGPRDLHVSWAGGIGPFSVELIDGSGSPIASRSGIDGRSTVLPGLDLRPGGYRLAVAAGGAHHVADIVVVGDSELPETGRALLAQELPERLGLGYLAMFLAAYENWRFEALQLAHAYDLAELRDDLRAGAMDGIDGGALALPVDPDRRDVE